MDETSKAAEPKSDVQVDSKSASLQLSDFYERESGALDTNRDGFVARTEVETALYARKYKGNDVKLAELLSESMDQLKGLSNDEWGPDYKGVTSKDMQVFAERARTNPKDALISTINSSYGQDERDAGKLTRLIAVYKNNIDKDHSGKLSKPELQNYIATSQDRPAVINSAKFLLEHFTQINELPSSMSYGGDYRHVMPGDYDKKGISDYELTTLNNVMLPEDKFRALVADGRSRQTNSGIADILFGSLVASQNKHSDLFKAVGNAYKVNGYIQVAEPFSVRTLMSDYKERRTMINSWNYFRK